MAFLQFLSLAVPTLTPLQVVGSQDSKDSNVPYPQFSLLSFSSLGSKILHGKFQK
jgi:hypothetical protein